MLFSGAAISLAAWGHWVPEHSPPALLPVCLPASKCLPACLPACRSVCMVACVSLCLWDYLSLSRSPICSCGFTVHVCVCGEAQAVPQGSGSQLWDSMADNRSFFKITGPCSVRISHSVSPLVPAPVLNSAGKVVEAIKPTPSLSLSPS